MIRSRYLWPILLLTNLASAPSNNRPPNVRFVDVAEQAGLTFRHTSGSPEKNYLLEVMSGGVAWIDYNRDGRPDLYFVNGGRWDDLLSGKRSVSNALYRNEGNGTFTDVTRQAGVEGAYWGMGVAVGDYNNDGWPDLYVCNYGPNILYRNNGDGSFTDVTASARVGDSHWSSSAAFGDYDGDGWLDLYVVNYVEFNFRKPPPPECQYRQIKTLCGPKGLIPEPDTLYHNNGDGTFSDVTKAAGMAVSPAFGLGASWVDYDNDGDLDLFVANDSMPNFLFQNEGDGHFREIGLSSGTALSEDGKEQAGMGVAVGDYDHDGLFDLYVTHFSDDYGTLYRNLGRGIFRDVSYNAKVAFPSWRFLGWGTDFIDYDNDGWEDLFVAAGHIYPQLDAFHMDIKFSQRKLLFRNLQNGKFEESAESLGPGLVQPWSSRGAAFADFDNDGDVDVAVNNLDDRPSLLCNQGGNHSGHWLNLALEGTGRTNRSAIGCRVTIETDSGRQMKEVQGGSSYQASNDLRLHFGLGKSEKIRSLSVRWTDGVVQTFSDVDGNQRYHLVEGKSLTKLRP